MSSGTVSLNQLGKVVAGNVEMTIDPSLGARILTFSLNGSNILLEAPAVAGTDNANNFGVTYWPSPQTAWGWPPIAAIDNEKYDGIVSENELVFTSGEATLLDGGVIALTKRFAPVLGKNAIDVTYQLKNIGKVPVTLAAWQIARVRTKGLTFFRLGTGGVTSDKLATQTMGGVQYYAYNASVVVEQGQKTFADATGWVAHVDGTTVFVQSYPDLSAGQAAEGEAEMELYADPSHTYIEIEPQGKVVTIAAGGIGPAWTVRFWLTKFPTGTTVKSGNAELVTFVEELISG
jgi:hypothetical protein